MKKVIWMIPLTVFIIIGLFSCEKLEDIFDHDEPACSVANGDAVPKAALEAFTENYPNKTVLTWCESDAGYIALFSQNGREQFALFAENGQLIFSGDDDAIEKRANCECELFIEEEEKEELVDLEIIDLENLDPSSFSDIIDNPYFPLIPGTIYTYTFTTDEGVEEKVVTEVTSETREILGISCIVVHDQEFEDDELVEDTYDWYAQDADGNVWYMGEDTEELEDGEVISTAGSWEAGVDGAEPGIIMLASPEPGLKYRQEFYAGEAEDLGEVVSLDNTVTVPYGTFENCLKTMETTPLEPDVLEYKFYAPGVGFIQAQDEEEPTEQLVSVEDP